MRDSLETISASKTFTPFLSAPFFRKRLQAKIKPDSDIHISVFNSNPNLILIRLNDESDPLFLFELEIDQVFFSKIKGEQQLRIDFSGFVTKFAELVELANGKNGLFSIKIEKVSDSSGSKVVMKIVESNEFKELDHLVLHLAQANDEKVKSFLSGVVSSNKLEIKELLNKLEFSRKSNDDANKEINFLKEELSRVKDELKIVRENSQKEFEKKLYALKEDSLNSSSKLSEQFAIERTKMQSSLDTLTTQLRDIKEEKDHSLIREKDLRQKLRSVESELTSALSEVEKQKRNCRDFESKLSESEIQKAEIKQRLDQEIQKKNSLELEISESKSGIRNLNEIKSKVEDQIFEKTKTIEKLQTKLADSALEINKANDLMEQFESELKKKTFKNKELKQTCTKLEKEITEKMSEMAVVTKQLAEVTRQLEDSKSKETSLNFSLQQTSEKLSEAQKNLEVNQTTISFLNQKLAENSRPFLKTTTTRDHPWVGGQTQLSSTAQAILGKLGEEKPNFSNEKQNLGNDNKYLFGATESKLDRSYLDSLKDTNNDHLAFLRTETKRTVEQIKRDKKEIEDEVPRSFVAKTIQPVKFRGD